MFFMSRIIVLGMLLFSVSIYGAKSPRVNERLMIETLKLPVKHRYLALRKMENHSLPYLRRIVNNKKENMSLRWRALSSLAKIYGRKSLPDLLKASRDSQWYMRNGALVGLAHVDKDQALKLSKRLLQDDAMVVRAAAVNVLAEHGDNRHKELIWKSLNNPKNFHRGRSLWIRKNTARAFLSMAAYGDESKMVKLLGDKDKALHAVGVLGLERLAGKKLEDPYEFVMNKKKYWTKWWQDRSLVR